MRLYPDERGASAPLSKSEFARLVAENPDASDEEILARATGQSEPSLASRIFEKPILPELEIENPIAKGAYGVVRNVLVGSPADLALNVATLGAATAPRLGLMAARPALRAAAGGLSAAMAGRGLQHAANEDLDTTSRAFGLLQGVLGGVGAASELRAVAPRFERMISNEEGVIKIPAEFAGMFKQLPDQHLKNEHAESVRDALRVREVAKPEIDPEVLARAQAALPDRGSIPTTPTTGAPAYTFGKWKQGYKMARTAKIDIELARHIRQLDAENFSNVPINQSATAIANKLREESNGLIDIKPAAVSAIIKGESWVEPGMITRSFERVREPKVKVLKGRPAPKAPEIASAVSLNDKQIEIKFNKNISRDEARAVIAARLGKDDFTLRGIGRSHPTKHFVVETEGATDLLAAQPASIDDQIAALRRQLQSGARSQRGGSSAVERLEIHQKLAELEKQKKAGAGAVVGSFATPLATSVASQFIDDENDPSGAIRLGLAALGAGSLGAAAYWQLSPQSKLSTLASGQKATGKSFEEFKQLATSYVPDAEERQLARAWKFAEGKVRELKKVSPRAFQESYWEKLYDSNPAFKDWWKDALGVAKEVAPENPELFALFLSATSPRKPPKQNLQLAIRAWNEHKAGKPFSKVFDHSVLMNLDRAVEEGRIGGRKTSSMVETVLQKENEGPMLPRAVLDRHMATLAGFGRNRSKPDDLTPPEYEILERVLENVAKKKGVSLSELQAGLWKTGMDISANQHMASLGRDWQKPDIAYPFGQIKKVLDAEARVTPDQSRKFVRTAKKVIEQSLGPSGGSTVDPRTGSSLAGKGGFAVSMFPERTLKVPADKLNDSIVLGFIRDNVDLLEQQPFVVGSWLNPKDGRVWLDVVAVVKDRHHAEWLGSPLRYNQMGVADLSKTTDNMPFPDEAFIPTGGTGSGFGPRASEFYDRIADLETTEIEHYSRKSGISELDPSYYGSGEAGEEKRRKGLTDWMDRVYAYVKGTPAEARFRGALKYAGRVPTRALYDLDKDPLGLTQQVGFGPDGLNRLEKMIVEAGFMGTRFRDRPNWLALFSKIPVEPVEDAVRKAIGLVR